MGREMIKKIFPEKYKLIQKGQCPSCKKVIEGFRNAISLKEYRLSGLCQECQDGVFGVD